MSSDSLAIFRKGLGPDLSALAEKHLQHDLNQSDRTALLHASSTVHSTTTLGTLLGLTLSLLLAYRTRRSRQNLYQTLTTKTSERPTAVRFASGREEILPDIRSAVKPSRLGDVATYTLLGLGGVFLGGEMGLVVGSFRARSMIARDGERSARIQNAFKRFQAEALRERARGLEKSLL